jgi:anti-sigma regulatory factor (Ser/Thr protein kinase)
MSSTLTLAARNRLEELSGIAEQVADFLEAQGCDANTMFAIQFALEELFSNIVLYAFDDDKDGHPIVIRLERETGGLTLMLEDDGRTFDPLSAPVPDTSLPLDQRPIGGLGLFITQRLASSIEYRRVDGKNRVTVRFMIQSGGVETGLTHSS